MKHFWSPTGLALAIFWMVNSASAADFSLIEVALDSAGFSDTILLEMSGTIEEGDSDKFEALLSSLEASGHSLFRRTTMRLDSDGGSLDPGIALANKIREWGIATEVSEGARCLSSCAIVFMSGSFRDGDGTYEIRRVLNSQGVLGFHAPFAFHGEDIPEDLQLLLVADAERGGAIAASKLVKMSLNDMLPSSLVEELLQYDAGSFLYVDTVYRAGRWKIAIAGETKLEVADKAVMLEHDKLGRHCENHLNWNGDYPFEDRGGFSGLPEGSLSDYGMDTSCEYEPYGGHVSYRVVGDRAESRGDVLNWHTLSADTPLSSIDQQLKLQMTSQTDLFSSPPPSQIDGRCVDGYQWIGGWSGAFWSDATAHATFRQCDGRSAPVRFECQHGTGEIRRLISVSQINPRASLSTIVTSKVDDKDELGGGAIEFHNNQLLHVQSLKKGYFSFDHIKAGKKFILKVDDVFYEIHLSGSRQAFEAMEASCL